MSEQTPSSPASARQLFEYHPTFGYRFIPRLKARVDHEGGGYLVRVNGQGFRCDHEFSESRQPGSRRVLLFGDSYTAGDGVSNKKRYGDRLEQLVPGVEVYNFGLSGSGTDQQYLIFQEHVELYEHDLVVIGVLVENIRRVAARYREYATNDGQRLVLAKPYFTRNEDGELELHQVPVPRDPISESELGEDLANVDRGGRLQWLRQAVGVMGPVIKDVAQRVTRYQPLPAYDDPDNPDWLLMKGILKRWIGACKSPVLVCPIPLYQYIEGTASPDAYRARFRELESDTVATVHDPLDDLLNYPMSERRNFRFASDCHLSPAGHDAVARSLAPAVQRQFDEART